MVARVCLTLFERHDGEPVTMVTAKSTVAATLPVISLWVYP